MTLHSSPHAGAQIIQAGMPLADSGSAIVLLHGRGGSAREMVSLGEALRPEAVTYLAPQAANHTWYPNSFMAPIESNEPWLSSALALTELLVTRCEDAGISSQRLAIVGFSQGACLATEYVARHPRHYAALVAFTGGLIGPAESDLQHSGSLSGTRVLLSSGDPDPHVPWSRVEASAKQLTSMGACVELLSHPGRPHTILDEEIIAARNLLRDVWTRS